MSWPKPADGPAPTTGRIRPNVALLLIPLAALIAVLPLIVHGCSCGHDFDFHLLSWMEAANQFSHGNLHPHWAYTPAFNAGEPRFVFYPPLSWILGALLGLLLTHLPGVSEAAGWTMAPILFTWIALSVSGFTLYRLTRRFAGEHAALFAAIVYLANPYMLFTAYERTAYAELLAAAWIPLLLEAILSEEVTLPRIALPIALLWLTNAPAAVMGSYTLALLAALRLVTTYRAAPAISRQRAALRLALKAAGGEALGLGLAAFYVIPAAYERRFVQIAMATIVGMRIDHNFLFEHTGASSDAILHDQVLHTASLIAVLLLAATAIALAATLRRKLVSPAAPFPTLPGAGAPHLASEMWVSKAAPAFPLAPLAILAAVIAFALTPLSNPIWSHAPEASFLQFPWRLLAILAPVFALALARAITSSPLTPSVKAVSRWVGRNTLAAQLLAAATIAAALTLPAYHLFHQPCDPEDTAPARLALFHSNAGTDPTDEYTPADDDNDSLKPGDPPYWLASSPDAPPPAGAEAGSLPSHLTIVAPEAEWAILNLRYYPNWLVHRQGTQDNLSQDQPKRADGLIDIRLPPGASTLDISYRRSRDETAGDTISLVSLALLFSALRTRRLRDLVS
jgi:hypothetical protein